MGKINNALNIRKVLTNVDAIYSWRRGCFRYAILQKGIIKRCDMLVFPDDNGIKIFGKLAVGVPDDDPVYIERVAHYTWLVNRHVDSNMSFSIDLDDGRLYYGQYADLASAETSDRVDCIRDALEDAESTIWRYQTGLLAILLHNKSAEEALADYRETYRKSAPLRYQDGTKREVIEVRLPDNNAKAEPLTII